MNILKFRIPYIIYYFYYFVFINYYSIVYVYYILETPLRIDGLDALNVGTGLIHTYTQIKYNIDIDLLKLSFIKNGNI